MTTRWRPGFEPDHLYFITTTAAARALIFQDDLVKRIVTDSLYYICLMNRVTLYAFVLMPNHLHVILQCPEQRAPPAWARALKSATSRLIVRHYQVAGNLRALRSLRSMVTRPHKQAHKVWEDGYLAKEVWTPDFLAQKVEYIHNNPVQPHWLLAEAPEDYAWSSARFYLRDEPSVIPVADVRELMA
jgi:putative transposase